MALTNKEKMARKRQREKSDPEKRRLVLEKDRERKARARGTAKEKMTLSEWNLYRTNENARVRKLRSRHNTQTEPKAPYHLPMPYKSPQAMGKAVKRARSTLPTSPRKRKVIAAALAKEAGIRVVTPQIQSPRGGLSEDTKAKVTSFYTKDEISWQAPGRKDRVIIRSKDEKGQKLKTVLQCRYMLMSLAEAHKLYCQDYINQGTIGLSKFCDLRPKEVKLFDTLPHNVCICTYHENIRLRLVALKNVCSVNENISAFTESVVCDPASKLCMTQECTVCKDNIDQFAPPAENSDEQIQYQQWQTNDRVEKVLVTAGAAEVFKDLKTQLKSFLIHVYVKRKQAAHMIKLQNEVDGRKILLQVDFSENATLHEQDEIQSVHWGHGQATVFTAHAWIDATDNTRESIVIISDELQHTKLGVHAFMSHIFAKLQEKHPSIKHIDVYSDGASSQFKQRFLFSNLFGWQQQFGIKLQWHFFATSHGKGVVDGIGGTVKRSVWRYVRSGKVQASTPKAFFDAAVARNPEITVNFITKESIHQSKEVLEAQWSDTTPVANTHKLHFVKPKGSCHLLTGVTSDAQDFSEVRIRDDLHTTTSEETMDEDDTADGATTHHMASQDVQLNLHVRDWVVVKFQQQEYPGEITELREETEQKTRAIQVTVMHRSGNNWKWPRPEDKIYYNRSEVVKKIAGPIVVGNRGQFMFSM